jgi:DNA-binding winged helix-turn-helix (wHTH) protein
MRAMSDQIVLAKEPDFRLGGLEVCPARRQIVGGAASETLQPRVMQVLVALAGRRGDVVSRDELMARCWGGFAVSDDSIHRCIARLRRLSENHGGFALETVPRVGYRLVEVAQPTPRVWKTAVIAGAAGLTLIAAGLVYWL